MSIIKDEHGIPYGWEDVRLTEEELDELCEALFEREDEESAQVIVEGAYDRLFGEGVH